MTKYENPTPTVDCIISVSRKGLPAEVRGIVLIRRKNPPIGWALPGGFVDRGEPLHHAAVREAKEETGLDVALVEQFFTYSDPKRDPRMHTISTVYIGTATEDPVGSDDAAEARVFALDALPEDLCFDHGRILADYRAYVQSGVRPKI